MRSEGLISCLDFQTCCAICILNITYFVVGGGWLYRIDENRCAVLYWGSGSLISGWCSLELQTVIQFRRGRRMKRPV
uniref:Uncharacterized protein n=1 Tax=Kalanchoe fedtschenkoi TaxID=63787 RepID=A0A7N0ZZL9_KALFE